MKQDILSSLGESHPWADRIHWFHSIDSTNDRAKTLAQEGAPHGTVLIADQQTKGRGRMGRSFQSPGGLGIYLSVILRPQCAPQDLMHLTCAVAEAMCDAVEAVTGLRPGIKWINDLVADGKKLGGILTELSLAPGNSVHYAVVGIGINCAQRPEDFPEELRPIAVSLETATGKPISRCALAAAMIRVLEKTDRRLLAEKNAIMDAYKRDCITLGREVAVLRGDEKQVGTALDIDADGGLLVRFPDGGTKVVNSGDVSVRGLYGYC